MRAAQIDNIVIHCSAGFGTVESILKFWKNTLGWKTPGYHRLIDQDGQIHNLLDFDKPSNGVAGYNSHIINICYIGGVEKAGVDKRGQVIWKGKDTRTQSQKYAIEQCISEAREWLGKNGKNIGSNLGVVGHYQFSPDQNGDGVIASWERIKECPCFDPIAEYSHFASKDRRGLLPTVKTPSAAIINPPFNAIHVVVKGDTLSKIAESYKTTYQKIVELNGLKSTVIQIGQKLKIA